MQFFLGDPQGYKGPEVRYAGGLEGLRDDAAAAASTSTSTPPTRQRRHDQQPHPIPSRKLLQQHARSGCQGMSTRCVTSTATTREGFDNWRRGGRATDLKLPLLIENIAGANAMTRYLERIDRVFDARLRPGRDRSVRSTGTPALAAKGLIVSTRLVTVARTRRNRRRKGFDNWRKADRAGHRPQAAAADREHRRRRQRDDPPPRAHRPRLRRPLSAEGADMVGFCLDTCHAHAGGNALETRRRRRLEGHRPHRPRPRQRQPRRLRLRRRPPRELRRPAASTPTSWQRWSATRASPSSARPPEGRRSTSPTSPSSGSVCERRRSTTRRPPAVDGVRATRRPTIRRRRPHASSLRPACLADEAGCGAAATRPEGGSPVRSRRCEGGRSARARRLTLDPRRRRAAHLGGGARLLVSGARP